MRCSKCGSESLPDKRFCSECGNPFPIRCPKCGADSLANAKFCADCGTALTVGIAAAQSSAASLSTIKIAVSAEQTISTITDGERKTVTALFADIKGSTELMAGLDPEEARTIVDPALKIMIEAARRYDGYVVQSTGDGIFVLFGAPLAHEDHPQRALYAALRMQEGLRRYSANVVSEGGTPVQARIGVNTGEVVVRTLETGQGHTEYVPIGHSTNLAARMQTAAPVGSIAVTEATRRLCEGYFTFKLHGLTIVKGISEPVQVCEVTGLGALRTRLQRAASRGLTRFVGRDREMETLRHAALLAHAGHGQVVAVMAEPGVGKSRMFHEFKLMSQSEWIILEAFSLSHGKASSYLPVIELLKDYFEFAAGDDERKRRERVSGKILTLDRSLEDALPYLFTLLSLNSGDDPLVHMDVQIKRRRTHEALRRVLLRESLDCPLMLIFEDLHWIDSETQGLLNVLVDGIANAPILLLVNYRPEYRHDWGNRTYYSQLRLDPLGRKGAGQMLSTLLGDEPELESLKRLITDKTDGNPFFVEEIAQALLEQGIIERNGKLIVKRSLGEIKIPATVEALLASRIDRLPLDEKTLLQLLAVIGRDFAPPLIQEVTASSEAELERMLGDLQRSEFIYEKPAFPDAEYTFKHALTQEVAYGSILIERRKLLHERVADAIESLHAGRLEESCEALAHHYSRSANTWKAVRYLHMAGEQAIRRSAYTQGINQFHSSLQLLETLPDNLERIEQELVLQIDAGLAMGQAIGYSAVEAGQAFIRARELCEKLTETPRRVQVMWGLWYFYFARAEYRAARDVAEQCIAVARKLYQPALLAQASFILGGCQLVIGDLAASRESLQYAIRSFDRQLHVGLGLQILQDPQVSALCPLALVYWHLGYIDRAVETIHQALNLAQELSHPYSQTFALGFSGWVYLYRGEARLAEKSGQAAISFSSDRGFPLWRDWGRITKGRALAELGKLEEGIDLIYQGLDALQSSESELHLTFALALLAQTQQELRLTDQGLATLDDALERTGKTGERYYEPELYRLKGELLLASSGTYIGQAQTCFLHAIEVARKQSAKSWELRAMVSLARLMTKQGRREEAQTMLSEIYHWFTEGFDTIDLKAAKALLDQLQT